VTPHAQVFAYQDFDGNTVHHFDVPAPHSELRLESRSLVEVRPPEPLPDRLAGDAWARLDALAGASDTLAMVLPSAFARPTDQLRELAAELEVRRRDDPLTLLLETTERVRDAFGYSPKSTHARSPIDEALSMRQGVCQDFAHIFIALARTVGIPCRYVSGYLFHRTEGDDADRSAEDGSHAWVEALLPDLGWVGFDPTNNLVAEERHIRVAVGRDYADVPPTRGVYKGKTRSVLRVGVQVKTAAFPAQREEVEMPELAYVTQGDGQDLPPGALPPPPAEAQAQQQ
jgi:transglutaminase-like putative cysteine protease